uniref:p8 movement protein n=1 Tax=Turnip crinkle virus TaxID=11988 RepID=A0A481S1Z8_TCV|nr:p8 movement protein [Turnip crinkle virus]
MDPERIPYDSLSEQNATGTRNTSKEKSAKKRLVASHAASSALNKKKDADTSSHGGTWVVVADKVEVTINFNF